MKAAALRDGALEPHVACDVAWICQLVDAELHLDRKELDKSKKVPDGAEVFLK